MKTFYLFIYLFFSSFSHLTQLPSQNNILKRFLIDINNFFMHSQSLLSLRNFPVRRDYDGHFRYLLQMGLTTD